jgi:hypothetical protein
MTYETVFDVAQNAYTCWWISIPCIVVLAAALVVAIRMPPPWGPGGRARKISDWLSLGLGALIPLVSLASFGAGGREAAWKLRNENYAVVEGRVTDFVASPASGLSQKEESFVVDGRRFTYQGYNVSSGFHQVASQGGPIHEGLYVRITYTGPQILRLEIAR